MANDHTRSHLGSSIRTILLLALLMGAMMGLGFLVTRVFTHLWPFTIEARTMRDVTAARTPAMDHISYLVSLGGFTICIISVTLVAGGVMRWVFHRWRESLFLAAALLAQGIMYKLTSIVVARARPSVLHLDDFPAMRSFFSGHTSATVALYCGIAVVISMHVRGRSQAAAWWALLLVAPVAVAVSRVYRGMHYPSDVATSFIVGLGCLWILQRAMLAPPTTRGQVRP